MRYATEQSRQRHWIIRDLISKAGGPMHVKEILRQLGEQPTRHKIISLTRSMKAQRDVYALTAPCTFDLKQKSASLRGARMVHLLDRPTGRGDAKTERMHLPNGLDERINKNQRAEASGKAQAQSN